MGDCMALALKPRLCKHPLEERGIKSRSIRRTDACMFLQTLCAEISIEIGSRYDTRKAWLLGFLRLSLIHSFIQEKS